MEQTVPTDRRQPSPHWIAVWGLAASLALLASCSSGGISEGGATDGRSSGDTAGAVDDASGETGSRGTADGASAEDGSPGTPDTEKDGTGSDDTAERSVRRFIAMGDTGEGNDAQERVSKGARARCDRAGGCHGFLMLGDNIYDSGADSANDEQFRTKIDEPYRNLKYGPPPEPGESDDRDRLPIYVTLGNHDLGLIPLNRDKINYNIDYADRNSWYYFPAEIWDKRIGPVHLVGIHTNPMVHEGMRVDMHTRLVERVRENTSADWTVAIGHHPYRSNGQHGNAGEYDGVPLFGEEYREWVNEEVCGKIDFLITGHDHNRQWLEKMNKLERSLGGDDADGVCETHMGVSGAGAKLRDIEDQGNATAFSSAELGFMFLEFRPGRVDVEFCDADGNTEWSKTIAK